VDNIQETFGLAPVEAMAAGLPVDQLLTGVAADRRPYLETTLVWLAKQGLVDWL
jgi:glycosyltransferase involved in cell wall biosynthesis